MQSPPDAEEVRVHALQALTCEAIGGLLALCIFAAGRWLTGLPISPTPLHDDEDQD